MHVTVQHGLDPMARGVVKRHGSSPSVDSVSDRHSHDGNDVSIFWNDDGRRPLATG